MSGNQKFRDLVADLILIDSDGNNLVVTSDLENHEDGSMSFCVGEDDLKGIRYKVTVLIEEI